MERYLTRKELFEIPEAMMPMPVLSDNLRNIFSAGIKAHTHGCYGHFMWLIAHGTLASMQTNGFKRVKLESFLRDDRLKFWWCSAWTEADRRKILDAIHGELKRPWWRNRYDFLSYIGHLTGWRWIQSPWSDVCSDKAKYIAMVDPAYDLENPNPEDVNRWLESRRDQDGRPVYRVYGRYTPD